jgi:cytochrome c oxidase subunit IV
MANHQPTSGNPRVDIVYRRKKNKEKMKLQVTSFSLMIFLTLIAFFAVGYDYSHWFIAPFIILLAVIQVIFQLYYFMHMSHKGHEAPSLFLYTGVLVGAVTVLAFSTIIWW